MPKQIKIRVYPDGRIESETIGIKGKHCLGYLKDIENMTGAKTIKSKFTKEYTESETYALNEVYQENEDKN